MDKIRKNDRSHRFSRQRQGQAWRGFAVASTPKHVIVESERGKKLASSQTR